MLYKRLHFVKTSHNWEKQINIKKLKEYVISKYYKYYLNKTLTNLVYLIIDISYYSVEELLCMYESNLIFIKYIQNILMN